MLNYSLKQETEGNIDSISNWHKAAMRVYDFYGKRVLDIGCGSGSFLNHIRPRAAGVLGIDPNPRNIEFLQHRGIPAMSGYIEHLLPELAGKFDAATCFEVVEHLYTPWPIFDSIFFLLPPQGTFMVTTPNAFNLVRALKFLFQQKHHDPLLDPTTAKSAEHIRLWSMEMLKKAFSHCGFTNVKCYGMITFLGRVYVLNTHNC